MERWQRDKGYATDETGGRDRSYQKASAGHQKLEAEMRMPIRPGRSCKSASATSADLGAMEDSSEDDRSAKPHRRGHDYRNVQTRENGRMQLGDNTYITNHFVYPEPKRPSGADQDGKQICLLEALAFEHMGTRLANINIAQDQTCRWLFDTDEYRQWRQGFRSSRYRFLWIKGKPGSGKSTLMATALQQASGDFRYSIVASFFFNARGDRAGRTTQGMYRTLLHQILSQLPELPSGVPSQVSASLSQRGWSVTVLQNMLRTTLLSLPHSQSLVCFVDALDECAEDDIREALRHFEELRCLAKSHQTKFLVCFASRHYPRITIRYHRDINLDEQLGHHRDISKYLDSVLRIPGALGVELHDLLLARCAGTFLWVVLTVKSLNKLYDRGGTRSQLLSRMREIPDRIEDLFRDILKHRDVNLLPILQWILYARRTLNVQELYFAVAASTGKPSTGVWNRAEIDLPTMKKFLLASSKGLIEFWEDQEGAGSHAQLIHESLREYLLDGGLVELDPHMENQVASISHARLAQWCLGYVTAECTRHIEEAVSRDWMYLNPATVYPSGLVYDKLPFLEYVLSNIVDHITVALAGNVLPDWILERFTNLWLSCRLGLLNWRAQADCAALLYFSLLQHGDRYYNQDLGRLQIPRYRRISYDVWRPRDWNDADSRWFPFQAAAHAGSIDISKLFFERSSDHSFIPLIEEACLRSAAEGQKQVLELLLQYFGVKRRKSLDEALLLASTLHLQENTTNLLLHHGVNPNTYGKPILCSLARYEDPVQCNGDPARARLEIATILLDSGADTKGALVAASKAGRTSLARLLTSRGATISRSAISIARQRGRSEILDVINEVEAHVDEGTDGSVYTSDASTAAVNGHDG